MAAAVFGCAASSAPATSPEESAHEEAVPAEQNATPVEADAELPAAAEGTPPGDTESTAVVDQPPASATSAQACQVMCDKLKARCSTDQMQKCQTSCSGYTKMPTACQARAVQALTCAQDAQDLLCINVAPESCREEFSALTSCVAHGGEGDQVAPVTASAPALTHEDWPVHEDRSLGIRLRMPTAPALAKQNEHSLWLSTTAAGSYYVGRIEPPDTKNIDRLLLQSALAVVDPSCKPSLKLHGRYDVDGVEHVFFDAACAPVKWSGKLLVRGSAVYVVAVKAEDPELAGAAEYLQGLELK